MKKSLKHQRVFIKHHVRKTIFRSTLEERVMKMDKNYITGFNLLVRAISNLEDDLRDEMKLFKENVSLEFEVFTDKIMEEPALVDEIETEEKRKEIIAQY
jgi:hypothetical protein